MDIERTMQFILETQAQIEATLQQLMARQSWVENNQRRLAEGQVELTEVQTEFAQNLTEVVQLVRSLAEENHRDHQQFRELHQQTDERFNTLIKMMDEWIRGRGPQNGRA